MLLRPRIWVRLSVKLRCAWKVMQLSPAQALALSSQSCGVQILSSDLRDTYGRSFVVKPLDKINHDCSHFFPKTARELISQDWPQFSKSLDLSLLTPLNTNSVSVESPLLRQEQLDAFGIDPNHLAFQALSHGSQSHYAFCPPRTQ